MFTDTEDIRACLGFVFPSLVSLASLRWTDHPWTASGVQTHSPCWAINFSSGGSLGWLCVCSDSRGSPSVPGLQQSHLLCSHSSTTLFKDWFEHLLPHWCCSGNQTYLMLSFFNDPALSPPSMTPPPVAGHFWKPENHFLYRKATPTATYSTYQAGHYLQRRSIHRHQQQFTWAHTCKRKEKEKNWKWAPVKLFSKLSCLLERFSITITEFSTSYFMFLTGNKTYKLI